jgi:putative metal-binding protein
MGELGFDASRAPVMTVSKGGHMMTRTMLAAALTLRASAALAAPGAPIEAWAQPGGYVAVAVDAGGHVYGFRQGPGMNELATGGYVYSTALDQMGADGTVLWTRVDPGSDVTHSIYQRPIDVAVDAAGNVTTVQLQQCSGAFHNTAVWMRYDPSGQPLWGAPSAIPTEPALAWNLPVEIQLGGTFNYVKSVAVDGAGNLFFPAYLGIGSFPSVPAPSSRLARWNPSPEASTTAPTVAVELPPEILPELFYVEYWLHDAAKIPIGVAVADARGTVWVAAERGTARFDAATLALLDVLPVPGYAVAVDALGDAYVTGPAGTFKLAASDGAVLWSSPTPGTSVALDEAGRVYVGGAVTERYGKAGALEWSIPSLGGDVAVGADGAVYVSDGAGAIHKLVPDEDGDGSPRGQDCNDADPSVRPGASEVRSDGVDQDCNGYDLTIVVTRALCQVSARMLRVEATSALRETAGLVVQGYGPMAWNPLTGGWALNARVASCPATVTVCGVEGCVAVPVPQR